MRAMTVANYLIGKSRGANPGSEARNMSHLKLQKILYYAQGLYLGMYGKPLFKDDIFAWRMGPVTKNVYDALKHYGAQNLTDSDWNSGTGDKIKDPEVREFLDDLWCQYAVEDANTLVAMTHSSGPWLDSYPRARSRKISPQAMQDYFMAALDNYATQQQATA
jgi:uncharacterized phage-associated protein